jgi:hypothetical protein
MGGSPSGYCVRLLQDLNDTLSEKLKASEAEVERLKELMSRLCESVAENWDAGIAEYFKDEMNK